MARWVAVAFPPSVIAFPSLASSSNRTDPRRQFTTGGTRLRISSRSAFLSFSAMPPPLAEVLGDPSEGGASPDPPSRSAATTTWDGGSLVAVRSRVL
eukprot:CAMPEP_0183328032 /NCGR_PEP_ID=MMETSP0160_2-20130417/84075_1 /TAXON_ID=2839 ORGANISM="Odontella Sinensis, Strain Grunow 1884" /NCGR_SAMPLE_ID=MMETSP0160_2 /ASSEMBLY_ACC=CAM_ASM_000250 /LENGTH=96 /DNA_ID=CAMNT_0025496185 /DNA_START=739 /DNA_END=1025 /DNA_ORIENTATION=+